MSIRELTQGSFTTAYKRPKFGSKDVEQTWTEACKKDKESQKVVACVARGCSVETIRETTLREFEPITPADLGGHANFERLGRVGAVSIITERQAKTNSNGFEFRFKKAVSHNGKIWAPGEGFNTDEMDVPAVEAIQRVNYQGIVGMFGGREAVDGAKLTEQWIERDLAERCRMIDSVIATGKRLIKGEAKTRAAKKG